MKASGKSWGKYNQALAAAVVIYILLAILIPKWIWLSQWLVKNHPNFDLGAWVQLRVPVILLVVFFIYHVARSPYEIYLEQYRKHDKEIAEKDGAIKNLEATIESIRALRLEVERVPCDVKLRNWQLCQTRVHNKSSTKTADNVQVEIIAFEDEYGSEPLTATLRPSLPIKLSPADGVLNIINPGARLLFDLFQCAIIKTIPITKDGNIVGSEPAYVQARFRSFDDPLKREMAAFQCGKPYKFKLTATARDFSNYEHEYALIFSVENGVCHFNLDAV